MDAPVKVPAWAIWFAGVVWVIAVFFGTAGMSTSREAFPITADGKGIVQCSTLAEDILERSTESTDWCVVDGTFIGPVLPDDVRYTQGDVILDRESIGRQTVDVLVRPEFWLATGLGVLALSTLYVFAIGTGTLRTGIAASVTVVFLGLLLFPGYLTQAVPGDLRRELIDAWKLLIVFYFGSEAAVQAWKVVHPEGKEVQGDVAGSRSHRVADASSSDGTPSQQSE